MTNDYMFRVVLQSNKKVLKGLIASLLHMAPEEIQDIQIQNPIMLGKTPEEKETCMDVLLMMNDNTLIDLEMQVHNFYDWQDRSTYYLCRQYENLNHGESYRMTKKVYQVGFLNYTFFPEHPEFFARYTFMNDKDPHEIYNDKLAILVLELNQIELATQEDRDYKIDRWAALFRAETWEQLQQIARGDVYMEEAVRTIYRYSQEDAIREVCEEREKYDYQRRMAGAAEKIREDEARIREMEKVISKNGQVLKAQEDILSEQEDKLSKQELELKDHEDKLSKQEQELKEKDALIAQLRQQLAEKQ
ncbi:MAG: Rpn family recombination-promoting nuclease/putative transposase [Lachnospiraceae bacterium]|nr:Rpn family recombination-promoting nuclease/putative transposase [Lachnospiraceae bacterium]